MGQKATIASKIVGLATVGVIGYDAHRRGSVNSNTKSQVNNSKALASLYAARLREPSSSALGQLVQDIYIDQRTKTKVFTTKDAITGYFAGIGHQIKNSVLPLGMAATAILGKGAVSKAGGIGLALYGIHYVLSNFIGQAHKKIL